MHAGVGTHLYVDKNEIYWHTMDIIYQNTFMMMKVMNVAEMMQRPTLIINNNLKNS